MGSAFKWLFWLFINTVSPTALGTRNRTRILIQNQKNWQKIYKIKLIPTNLDMHLSSLGSG
jgi:hypothetical protein